MNCSVNPPGPVAPSPQCVCQLRPCDPGRPTLAGNSAPAVRSLWSGVQAWLTRVVCSAGPGGRDPGAPRAESYPTALPGEGLLLGRLTWVLGFTPCWPLQASDLAVPSTSASHGEPAGRTEATVLQSLMREVTSVHLGGALLARTHHWVSPVSRGDSKGQRSMGASPSLRAQVRISNSISPTGSAK